MSEMTSDGSGNATWSINNTVMNDSTLVGDRLHFNCTPVLRLSTSFTITDNDPVIRGCLSMSFLSTG